MPELVVWTSLWGRSLPLVAGEAERKARFSYALREAMAMRNVSARALSKALGVDPRKITGWREGRVLPDLFESQELAAALGVDEELFKSPPEVPPPPPKPYYPIEKYLLDAAASGAAEGRRRATTPRAPGAADTPTPSRPRPTRGSAAGRG